MAKHTKIRCEDKKGIHAEVWSEVKNVYLQL